LRKDAPCSTEVIYRSSSARFEGSIDADGNRDGEGTYIWADGTVYRGRFKSGLMSGFGAITYSNGDTYVGEWENGTISGFGKKSSLGRGIIEEAYYCPGGASCVGPVKRRFDNGDFFNGAVDSFGIREGYGEYMWADGYQYKGMWFRDRTHGVGCWESQNGHKVTQFNPFVRSYAGNFCEEMRQGFGRADLWNNPLDPANGDYNNAGCHYEGSWYEDLFHNIGRLIYKPFTVSADITTFHRVEFDGEFVGGNRHGVGCLQQVELAQGSFASSVDVANIDITMTDMTPWFIGDCTKDNVVAALTAGHDVDALAHLLRGFEFRGNFRNNSAVDGVINCSDIKGILVRCLTSQEVKCSEWEWELEV
jgi:hypothetical protein